MCRRLAAAFLLLALAAAARDASAQPGATGPIADLNAQAKAASETSPDQSLAAAVKARDMARQSRDVRGEAEALNYIALAHRARSLLGQAAGEAEESIRLYKHLNDRWGESQGYNTLGLIVADAGRFADALANHLKALAIREAEGDKEGLSYTFNNLGNAYRNMGEYQKALDYHQRGLRLKQELGNKSSEAYSHHNIGLVYFAMQDYAGAKAAYERGLKIREELKDPRAMAVSLNAIGSVEALTDPAAALSTYQRALALRRQTGDERGEMATEINIADIHRRMKQLPLAEAAIGRAMALGNRLDAPLMKATATKALSEVEAARGDYANAYRHQLEYARAYDAIFSQETAERFHHLEVAQEAERKQQQIQLLERENELRDAQLANVRRSQIALGIIVVLVLLSLALLYARFRLKHESESRLRFQAEQLAQALARVQTLKGMLPICAWCKKVRDDKGYWTQVETYIASHSAAEFTHCICPGCYEGMKEDASAQPA